MPVLSAFFRPKGALAAQEKVRLAAANLAYQGRCECEKFSEELTRPSQRQSQRNHSMASRKVLMLGLPKGSLQEATIQKMAKAGFNIQVSSRSYVPYVDDDEIEIRLIRAQEISRYVEHEFLDCGITGLDWIRENDSKVHEVGEFQSSPVMQIGGAHV